MKKFKPLRNFREFTIIFLTLCVVTIALGLYLTGAEAYFDGLFALKGIIGGTYYGGLYSLYGWLSRISPFKL